jgi:hypothetical protein
MGALLTVKVPVRIRRAISRPFSTWAVHTPPLRPYSESLAMRTASSSSSKGITTRTGPKISSRAIRMLLSTSANRVGLT